MTDLTLPRGEVLTQEKGDRGAAVWGVQRAISRIGVASLALDGIYGRRTRIAVEDFQGIHGLFKDGRYGPDTSERMSWLLQDAAIQGKVLPDHITRALTHLESSDLMGANNWQVAGGVDLCLVQRRVYGPPFDEEAIKRAFDALYQFKLLANTLRGRHDIYYGQPGAPTHEWAWRLAICHHNYESGADRYAEVGREGLSSYYTTPQTWITSLDPRRRFDDGALVNTPLEWLEHYGLGSPEHHHEGVAVRGVSHWNVA